MTSQAMHVCTSRHVHMIVQGLAAPHLQGPSYSPHAALRLPTLRAHPTCCRRCRFNASRRDVAFYAFGDSSHLSLGSVTYRMKVVCRSFHLLQALPLERFQARLGLRLEVALHDETVLRRRTAVGIHARLCLPHLRHIRFLLETRHSTWTTAEGAPLPPVSSESAGRPIGEDIPQQDRCHRLPQCSKVVAGAFWL